MATLITSKPSMMAFPSALNRMGTFPIDISSVWYSYEDAVAYATQTNFEPTYEGQTGLPYVGQILTVVETDENGATSVTAYSIQNEAGDLARVGTVTLGDDASIVRDEETGVLALNGFADAEEGEFAVVGADGKLTWQKIAADEATITNDEGKMALYGIKDLTWKDGEGEDAADVAVYQPKLVKKDGKVVLTWEIPSAVTVEGLDTRLKTAEDGVKANADAIKVINETTVPGLVEDIRVINEVTIPGVVENLDGVEDRVEVLEGAVETINETTIPALEDAIEAVATDLADNYYDKTEVDAKLTSVFKFQGVKTYKSELPTTGQKVGDVWLVIYDGDAPEEGETNTLPVSNTEYVWTTENKWEDLGDDLVDLTNYYTKSEVDGIVDGVEEAIADLDEAVQDELAKKGTVSDVTNGTSDWSVTVSYADGTADSQATIKTVLAGTDAGLVKNGGVATVADGVITAVSEASHAAEATHTTNADDALRAVDATNAVNAQEAAHALAADEATHAASADEADEAAHALEADHALDADKADEADHATNADYATEAGKVTNALSLKINETTTKTFDGSAAESVDLSVYATGFALETAVNNMNQHIEDAGKSIEDINTTLDAIKGSDYTEGVSLASLKGITDTHAEQLDSLDDAVATANQNASDAVTTAGNANTTAGEAKTAAEGAVTTAGEAVAAANAASGVANEAKSQADAAVGTANAASGVANEAKTAAEGAVSTANTAKDTADSALAKAGANETAIKALQEKDTTIEGLVNTNTGNITTLTNTVSAGLADRYTKAETNTYVAEQIAAIDHLKREVVESLPGTPDVNTIYMVPSEDKINKVIKDNFVNGESFAASTDLLAAVSNHENITVKINEIEVFSGIMTDGSDGTGSLYYFGDEMIGSYYVTIDMVQELVTISYNAPMGEFTGGSYEFTWKELPADNIYTEYMYINQKWERIGTSEVDLSNYLTKTSAIDATTIGGVNTLSAIEAAGKTAEWSKISGKPSGTLVNKEIITLIAGQTAITYQPGFTKEIISYKAYLTNVSGENQIASGYEEVIIDNRIDLATNSYYFEITTAQNYNIDIVILTQDI